MLFSCGILGRRISKETTQVHWGLTQVVDQIAAQSIDGTIALLPMHDGAGKTDDTTNILDDYLISALIRAGIDVIAVEEDPKERWTQDRLVPDPTWERLTTPYLLSTRLHGEMPWRYLQMHLLSRTDKRVLITIKQRLSQKGLADELAASQQARGRERIFRPQIDLHIIFRRQEGDIVRTIPLVDKGSLERDDSLQLRFRVAQDCHVYAFLYSSEGGIEDVFPQREVYSGRMLYGPAQEGWVNLGQSDKVYTLYFIAAKNLEELDDLFEQMDQSIRDGLVNRLVGLEHLDKALIDFFSSRLEEEVEIQVVRDKKQLNLQDAEKIIYNDGTSIESQAEELQGSTVLIRAISFAVY